MRCINALVYYRVLTAYPELLTNKWTRW